MTTGIGGRGTIVDQKIDGKKAVKKGLPGINTNMAFQDYERIMGKDKVDDERQVAARKMSSKKGRWESKLEAIKSSLENFVPDVRPGNQTALKTPRIRSRSMSRACTVASTSCGALASSRTSTTRARTIRSTIRTCG